MLTAVEDFLVSLYGCRPPEIQRSHEKPLSPSNHLPTDASPQDNEPSAALDDDVINRSGNVLEGAAELGDPAEGTRASLKRQASNNSSSSSVAEDWFVNQIPAWPESNISPCDDQRCGQTAETGTARKSPERLEDRVVSAATSGGLIPPEDWSRGTALTDPATREPLQPVTVYIPSKSQHPHSDEGQNGSSKKTFNAITDKPVALTAYDLISNRALKAPLSPAALFEKEARANILKEKPAAGLQDISAAVHERWKNLREEDRKK